MRNLLFENLVCVLVGMMDLILLYFPIAEPQDSFPPGVVVAQEVHLEQ